MATMGALKFHRPLKILATVLLLILLHPTMSTSAVVAAEEKAPSAGTMKAAVHSKYGPPDVVSVAEIAKPTPGKGELLVKVRATTVTSGDVRLRASDFPPAVWLPARLIFGLFRPRKRTLGHEFAGVVEGTGPGVTKFAVGDEVFGTTTMLKGGAHAEYVVVPQEWKMGVVEKKPAGVGFDEAAALPIGGMTAAFLLEKAGFAPGQKVLVYGASGSVGTFAVQLVVAGGGTVTGVCSAGNAELVRGLGAVEAIDYATTDYSKGAELYDIVFDAVGKTTKKKAKKVLAEGGKYVSINMLTDEKSEHLRKIRSLAEEGKVRAHIDGRYPLEDIAKVHEYVDSGRKRGNVVIEVAP